MDERQIAEKFRDAVGEMPPPSFDTKDVQVASARATALARKRLQTGAGVAVGVVLIAGVLVLVKPFGGDTVNTSSAGSGPGPNAPSSLSLNPNMDTGPQSGKMAPNHTELGNSANCGGPDQGLAAALVTELPILTGAETLAADVGCPPGSSAVAYQTTDGSNSGKVEMVLVPASVADDPSTRAKPAVTVAKGNSVTVTTHSGGALTLASVPMNGSTVGPYAGQLGEIAARLAARY
jgi:hypothetical protein